MGYTLADGLEYLRAGIAAGLDIDAFAPRLSFFWAIGMEPFIEIAKLRAARLLWARSLGKFSPKIKVIGASLSLPDIWVVSYCSRCQQQHCSHSCRSNGGHNGTYTVSSFNSLDEALALPSQRASAYRNTQLQLQQEAGLCDVADPWGGSFAMEATHPRYCRKSMGTPSEIEELGGMTAACLPVCRSLR